MDGPDSEAQPRRIVAQRLHAAVRGLFLHLGSVEREAELLARHLVEANLRGHDSHGVGAIPAYIANARSGDMVLNQTLAVVLDTGATLLCEGGNGVGQVMAHDAVALGIARARENGACVVGLRNSHHVGRIGHWAEQCAEAGLVSLFFVNVVSDPAVAPFGGAAARLGTNPIAIGFPRPGAPPVIVDFATSRWAVGKVRVALNQGEPVPPGTLLDGEGLPTCDPAAFFGPPRGALMTFGEHKGWGLALACELLAAMIGGGTQSGPRRSPAIVNSMFSVIVAPERLGTAGPFAEEVEKVIAWITSENEPGATKVKLAGMPELAVREIRLKEGIPLDAVTLQQIVDAARSAGLASLDI